MSAGKVFLILVAVCVLGTISAKNKPDRLAFMKEHCTLTSLYSAEHDDEAVGPDDLMAAFAQSGLVELIKRLNQDLGNIENLGAAELEDMYTQVVCTMGALDVIGEKIYAGGDGLVCADGSSDPSDPVKTAECVIDVCQHILDVLAHIEANQDDEHLVSDDFIRVTLSINRLHHGLSDFSSEDAEDDRRRTALNLLRILLKSERSRQKREDVVQEMIDNCPGGDTINAELQDTTPDDPAQRLKIVLDPGLKTLVETVKAKLERYVSSGDGAMPDVTTDGESVLCRMVPFYAFQNHAYAGGEDSCMFDDAAAVLECLTSNFQNMKAETVAMAEVEGYGLEDLSIKAYNIWEHVSNLENGVSFFLSQGGQTRRHDELLRLLEDLLE